MTTRSLKDAAGKSVTVVDVDGFLVDRGLPGMTPEQIIKNFGNIPNFKCRDDDVILLSYPKTGVNWLNEVIMMLLNKSTEKPVTPKILAMLDFHSQDQLDKLPSPRCLNTHAPYQFIPKELKEKQLRTILIRRNPKDTLVSFYNHIKGLKVNEYSGEWGDWFQLYMKGEMQYGMYTDYLKGFEKAMDKGIGFPCHVIYYEDMKQNGLHEVKKLVKFLGIDVDEELCTKTVETCSFERMASKNLVPEEQRIHLFNDGFNMFRKGQVGDWVNWFTEEQNEQFDKYWAKEMADSKIKFTYTQNK